MSSQYYRGAKAAIICYDIAAADSFDKANFWIGELQQKEPVGCCIKYDDNNPGNCSGLVFGFFHIFKPNEVI
jgi:GTPase SAR1 family protein